MSEGEGSELHRELSAALNRVSAENGSDTPDFVLAQYLIGCLAAFDHAVRARERWHGGVAPRAWDGGKREDGPAPGGCDCV